MKPLKIQFILKRREAGPYGSWNHDPGYSEGQTSTLSSGLRNSVLFVVEMLQEAGIFAEVVEVTDNNDIDREVMRFKPTHVVVEAFWVIPEKFDVLKRLHPTVSWIVRSHSKSEFLSLEGMAFTWAIGYLRRGVTIAANSEEGYTDFRSLAETLNVRGSQVVYLPNYYPLKERIYESKDLSKISNPIHIACFGAIRPLKNHLVQALAAKAIARALGRNVFFHINATRNENGADPVLKNLRAIFDEGRGDRLVEHSWMNHAHFLRALNLIDLSMQVSYSETFNIVAADSVACGVPVIGSDQIPWLPFFAQADPNSAEDITRRGLRVFREPRVVSHFRVVIQKHSLQDYVTRSKHTWLNWIQSEQIERGHHRPREF